MSVCNREVLCFEQVKKLNNLLSQPLTVKGRGHFGSFTICLKDLVKRVKEQLLQNGITVTDLRMNGGAASHVLRPERECEDSSRDYGDLDLIYGVEIDDPQSNMQTIRESVIELIQTLLVESDRAYNLSVDIVKESYIQKMIKVTNDSDCWSLISLGYIHDPVEDINIELKFVNKMRRQFEFSVDSFQIILDSFLTFYQGDSCQLSEDNHPIVNVESVYGNISEAINHLNKKIIATRNPEQIRGGGLLKYCYLRSRGYKSAKEKEDLMLQKYMCSRFFIDYKDITQQKARLETYLTMHFGPEMYGKKVEYLRILRTVVQKSTVCLMGHEHQQILALISQMIEYFMVQEENQSKLEQMYISQFDWQQQNNLVIDQVFYGYCFKQTSECDSNSLSPMYCYPVSYMGSSCCSPCYSSVSGCSPCSYMSSFSPVSSPALSSDSRCQSPVQYRH